MRLAADPKTRSNLETPEKYHPGPQHQGDIGTARDKLRTSTLSPVVIVLHAAWHGIGDWRRDAFPTIQLPQPDDLVIEV